MQTLNIGLIGTGFMGRTHSNAYSQVNKFFPHEIQPVRKAVCARNPQTTAAFAAQWGWEEVETDWRTLVERARHRRGRHLPRPTTRTTRLRWRPPTAGKMIICEKPLAMNAAEARAMVEAVERSGKPTMVFFNYRRIPAVTLAKQLVDEGRLGPHLPLPGQVPAGLDHQPQAAAGRQHALAAGRRRRRQRRDRRPAGPLDRPGPLAGRADRAGHGHDRDLYQGAPAAG